jgi:phospholipid-binding lipoprotein MlaA
MAAQWTNRRAPPLSLLLILAMSLGLGLGFAAPAVAEEDELVWDPWEPMNRGTHAFNEWADKWFLEPVATGYDYVVPDLAQRSVANFFDNLGFPVRLANDLLQLKFVKAFEDTGRFIANSTVGLGGLFDVASTGGFPKHDEDFGQTMGYWGVPPGPYFVIPLLGPSSVRDSTGLLADSGISVHGYFIPFSVSSGLFVYDKLNDRSIALEALAAERASAFDFYVAARGAYSQFRENQILDRKDDSSDAAADDGDLYYYDEEDYEDEEFDEDDEDS